MEPQAFNPFNPGELGVEVKKWECLRRNRRLQKALAQFTNQKLSRSTRRKQYDEERKHAAKMNNIYTLALLDIPALEFDSTLDNSPAVLLSPPIIDPKKPWPDLHPIIGERFVRITSTRYDSKPREFSKGESIDEISWSHLVISVPRYSRAMNRRDLSAAIMNLIPRYDHRRFGMGGRKFGGKRDWSSYLLFEYWFFERNFPRKDALNVAATDYSGGLGSTPRAQVSQSRAKNWSNDGHLSDFKTWVGTVEQAIERSYDSAFG